MTVISQNKKDKHMNWQKRKIFWRWKQLGKDDVRIWNSHIPLNYADLFSEKMKKILIKQCLEMCWQFVYVIVTFDLLKLLV